MSNAHTCLAGKAGTCPKVTGGLVVNCIDECKSDYACPGSDKCCSNGVCKSCQKPIGDGGECPLIYINF